MFSYAVVRRIEVRRVPPKIKLHVGCSPPTFYVPDANVWHVDKPHCEVKDVVMIIIVKFFIFYL